MKKLFMISAAVLLVIVAIPITVAALQQNQTIHVTKAYTQPIPTPTPTPPPANTTTTSATMAPAASTLDFSLWFPNGTAYVLNQDGAPSIFGATNLDTNGVPVNVQSGLGASPMGYTSGVIVVRNDGEVPFTVNASLTNVNTPSDIMLTSTCNLINPALWGSQVDGWMGNDNLATGNVVGVGEYAWLSVCVIMTSSSGNMGTIQNHESFTYSFDVAVTATQA